jgi:tetratricopeptide (TPR) repeat protein
MSGTVPIRTPRRRRAAALAVVGVLVAVGVALVVAPRLRPDPLGPARASYEAKRYARAAAEARDVLKADPADREAKRLLARASARLGRDAYALGLFDAIGRDALRAEDTFLVGNGLLRLGEAEAARDAYRRALADDPAHPEALLAAALLETKADRLAAARPLADRLAAVPGWEARGLALAGMIRHEEGDPEGAVGPLERALARDPGLAGAPVDPPAARIALARDALRLGQPGRAAAALRPLADRLAATDPFGDEVRLLLGRVALQQDAAAGLAAGPAADPLAPEPAPHVGAAACASCHADIARLQGGTRHARTFVPASRFDRVKWPAGPIRDPARPDVAHALARQADGRVAATTRVGDDALRAWLLFAVGSGDRGLTPVARDETGQMRELRVSYYGDLDGWDRTSGHDAPPSATADWLGTPQSDDALRRCLGCHTTDWHAAWTGRGPAAADRGIGCEQCHGPGGNHLKAVAQKLADPAIVRPGRVAPAESVAVCARCHSPRGADVDLDRDPAAIRFQVPALRRSRCFTESAGALGCVSCHNPHRDADTDPGYYEARCLACHASEPPAAGAGAKLPQLPGSAPRTPCPVNPRAGCIECHMPQDRGAVPHAVFTDHFLRVRARPGAGP